MLRDNYKKAFSQINPSEETIERIFEMTEKKRFKRIHKGLIIAVALIAVLLCGSLTANAATDGALFEGISLIMNGEEINLKDYVFNYDSYVDEDGAEVEEYQFDLDGDGNGDSIRFELRSHEDYAVLVTYDTSVDAADGKESEYSAEQMMDITEKIFAASKEFSADSVNTNIPE